jgi:hypothetical protein
MRRTVLTLSLIMLVFTACRRETVYKEVQSDKRLFTILLPQYMSSTNTMFPGISILQYANDSVPLYALAFDTTRNGLNETSLEAFYDSTVSQPNMADAKIDKPHFLKIDGDSALMTKLSGTIAGEKLVYKIVTIATQTHFFYIQVWTRADKAKDMEPIMDKILMSFHDEDHKKV